MSRKCDISKKSRLKGHIVSHANNKSRKIWQANLKIKRLFDSASGAWVRVKVSARLLRTIDKKGLSATLRDHGMSIDDVRA